MHLRVFLSDIHDRLPVSSLYIQEINLLICFLYSRWRASLFSLVSGLSFALLFFAYSHRAINCFSFTSFVSYEHFRFLLTGSSGIFWLFKNKYLLFWLSWTCSTSACVPLIKTPLIAKGTTHVCKHDICKYDTRFSIPSMLSKVHVPNEWGIPCKYLEWESKILKLCCEVLINATVLMLTVNKQQL